MLIFFSRRIFLIITQYSFNKVNSLEKKTHKLKVSQYFYALYNPSNQKLIYVRKNYNLTSSTLKEIIGDDKLVKLQKNNPKGLNLLRFMMTQNCNLNCSYCKVINNKISSSNEKLLSYHRFREVFKFFLSKSKENSHKTIHITGGEPLIHFNYIKNIINPFSG